MTTDPAEDGTAEADVTASLRALSQTYQGLPSSVAERLDRALAELPELTAPDTAPLPSPPRKLPWWRKRYALASASLAVVAFVAGGLLFAVQPWQTSSEGGASNAQDQSNEKAEPFGNKDKGGTAPDEQPGAESELDRYSVTYSGRDYRQSDLPEAEDASTPDGELELPAELHRLVSDKTNQDECVTAVNREFDGTTESVDFGRYEGEPAMIAVVTTGPGASVAAAVGPQCGSDGPRVLGSAEF